MMTTMRRVLLPLSLTAVLALGAACGGEHDGALSDREQKAAQALAAEFQGNQPTAAQRDSGLCLGKELVGRAGLESLISSGMLTKELQFNKELPDQVPEVIAAAYADTVVQCQDVRAEIEERASFYPDATADDIDSYVACMEAIDEDLLRKAALESAMHDVSGTASGAYRAASEPCAAILGEAKIG